MTAHTRRTFLTTSAGLAAGAAFVGSQRIAGASSVDDATGTDGATEAAPEATVSADDAAAATNAVVYVRDAAAGTVVIMAGDTEQTIVDPALVAAIAGAGRK